MATAWLDRMIRRVRDAETEEEAREATKDFIDPATGQSTGGNDDGDTHIHLHMGKKDDGGTGAAGDDDPPIGVEGQTGEPDVQELAAAVAELLQRVEQLEGQLGGNGNGEEESDGEDVELEDPETKDRRRFRMRRGDAIKSDDEELPVPERNPDMIAETDLPGIEDLDKKMASTGDKRRTRDRYIRTTDSANAEDLWQDTMAAAEILQPGVRVPTFDARLSLESTAKRLCAFRRRVLDHALNDEQTKPIILDAIGTIDTNVLPCDSIKMAFTAAASHVRLANNQGITRVAVRDNAGNPTPAGLPSLAQMNANARDFWSKQGKGNGAAR